MNQIYDSRLYGYLAINIGVVIFFTCVTIMLFIICLKFKDSRMSWLSLVIGISLIAVLYFVNVMPLQKDIERKTYVTYKGEFYVEKCISASRGGTYIFICQGNEIKTERYRVRCNVDKIMDDTTYVGVYVYSKYSKCLVDISTEDTITQ